MQKIAELYEEMRGRVMARGFWDEHEKIAAGQGQMKNAGASEKATTKLAKKVVPGLRSSAREVGKAIGL